MKPWSLFMFSRLLCWLRRAFNLCGSCAAPLDWCLKCPACDYAPFDPNKTRLWGF